MKRLIINQNQSNLEFKRIVRERAKKLKKCGFVIKSIQYKGSRKTNRLKNAVIDHVLKV